MHIQISQKAAATLERLTNRMWVGGAWGPSVSGKVREVVNPADGERIAVVPAAQVEDIDRAVSAARGAFERKAWAHMRPADRERLLGKLADLLEANADEFAELETLDNGKSITM